MPNKDATGISVKGKNKKKYKIMIVVFINIAQEVLSRNKTLLGLLTFAHHFCFSLDENSYIKHFFNPQNISFYSHSQSHDLMS